MYPFISLLFFLFYLCLFFIFFCHIIRRYYRFWVYKKTMPLQLDAAPPEAYIWGGERAGPRAAEFVHFCSGPYGSVCSFRPICRTLRAPPPSTRARPGPPVPPTWQKDPLKDVPIYLTFILFILSLLILHFLLSYYTSLLSFLSV